MGHQGIFSRGGVLGVLESCTRCLDPSLLRGSSGMENYSERRFCLRFSSSGKLCFLCGKWRLQLIPKWLHFEGEHLIHPQTSSFRIRTAHLLGSEYSFESLTKILGKRSLNPRFR